MILSRPSIKNSFHNFAKMMLHYEITFVAESINFNGTGVWSRPLTTALLFVAESINFNDTGVWSRLLTTSLQFAADRWW